MKRLTAVWLLPLVILGGYVGRLVWLQGVRGEYYAALAADRAAVQTVVPAARGDILDCRGVRLSGDRAVTRVRLGSALSREQGAALLAELGETVNGRGDILCTEVSAATAARIRAHPERYGALLLETVPTREYAAGETAAHLLGTVGPLYAEEYAQLKHKGYRLTDRIGKSGVEAAFETVLRGTDGVRTVRADGSVEDAAATAGMTVVLTLDAALQQTTQRVLADVMAEWQGHTEPFSGQDVRSGAAVLLDVRDGGVLVCASCPTYDLSTYSEQYTVLSIDEARPLFNRALFGTFPCGSVIKPAVAVAAVREGVRADIVCDGRYRYYESVGFAPKCMGKHGQTDTVTALQRSCNVHFMELGRLLGIDALNRYASAFGLGQRTGIEIGEADGLLASPETKRAPWVAGDTCQCAIGQMDQRFTPIQLAAYAMTLANGGVRYRTHLLRELRRYDGTVTDTYTPEIAAVVDMTDTAAVHNGMMAVTAPGGTAYAAFRGAVYTLAAKTGTAQNGKNRSDHGVFIAYAPAEAPQVALAVVMENGTSSAACAAARRILDEYFAPEKTHS